jgi:glycosyltransferase involved in cell wall biosynthesis
VRILHVNKFLYRRGGAEGYMQDLATLQVDAGHQVEFFAMAHPENPEATFADRFPDHIELEPMPRGIVGKLKGAGRVLWSTSARAGITQVVEEFKPDVVHLHNVYHQLSPSILRPLGRMGVPAVMTLHDYKLACPTYQLLDHGNLCEACVGGHFTEAIKRRCKGGSLSASAMVAFETWLHSATRAYGPVGRFICPSRFLAGKMSEAGVFPDRLRCVPHFVDCSTIDLKRHAGGDIAFAGRLSPEKGVDTLIQAVGRLGAFLHVAGEGPEADRLAALADREAPGLVRFHGRMPKPQLHELLRSASVVAVPSRWHENQPMIVLEAMACGVPVVASDLGGLSELVEPGVNGALTAADDPDALAGALTPFLDNPDSALAMGRAARARVAHDFSPALHLSRLEDAYIEAGAKAMVAA